MNSLLVIKVPFIAFLILAGFNSCAIAILVPSLKKEKLGRILDPWKNEGNEMSQSIVASSDYEITRQTFRSLRTSELHSDTEKIKRRIFDKIILKKLGDFVAKPMKP